MANASLILQLISVYFDSKLSKEARDKHFTTLIEAYAADERRAGHLQLANRILKEMEKWNAGKIQGLVPLPATVSGLVEQMPISHTRANWVVSSLLEGQLNRVCQEWQCREKLAAHGVNPSHKLLFYGLPGTGKTMTCSVLADCLGLPFFRIGEGVIESLLGKSQTNLAKVFELINSTPGVYLFDEFDSLGMGRSSSQQEHAELRRTLNAFLQFLERADSKSMIVCATNMAESLDKALFRRFDQLWEFTLPDVTDRRRLIRLLTGVGLNDGMAEATEGRSQSELTRWAQQAIRESLIGDRTLDNELFAELLDRMSHPIPSKI